MMDIKQATEQEETSAGRRWLRRIGCGILAVIGAILGLSAASMTSKGWMAQAFLLDRLNTEWRTAIPQENVFLEDLMSEALAERKE